MVVNGTTYHDETPAKVIDWLETSRERKQRIRLFLGSEGRCWNEEYDIIGHVGRSTGKNKIPLLIHNSRSLGGGAILDHCIIRIDTKDSQGKIHTVYQKDGIQFDTFIATDMGTVYNETKNELYGRCKNRESAEKLADFMNGKRWCK